MIRSIGLNLQNGATFRPRQMVYSVNIYLMRLSIIDIIDQHLMDQIIRLVISMLEPIPK